MKFTSTRELLLFMLMIFWVILYFMKPQKIDKVIDREVKTHVCEDIRDFESQKICVISEACAKGGGQLVSFEDTNWHGPKFTCKYK